MAPPSNPSGFTRRLTTLSRSTIRCSMRRIAGLLILLPLLIGGEAPHPEVHYPDIKDCPFEVDPNLVEGKLLGWVRVELGKELIPHPELVRSERGSRPRRDRRRPGRGANRQQTKGQLIHAPVETQGSADLRDRRTRDRQSPSRPAQERYRHHPGSSRPTRQTRGAPRLRQPPGGNPHLQQQGCRESACSPYHLACAKPTSSETPPLSQASR